MPQERGAVIERCLCVSGEHVGQVWGGDGGESKGTGLCPRRGGPLCQSRLTEKQVKVFIRVTIISTGMDLIRTRFNH